MLFVPDLCYPLSGGW